MMRTLWLAAVSKAKEFFLFIRIIQGFIDISFGIVFGVF